ncbi:MAG: RAMP superfamily protein [Pseudonocardiales bacterium]|nr:MAG: RAMP superfamily protein [Pseudonocardiales bacterium]
MVVVTVNVNELHFVIDFLSPFRVSTGQPAAGVDATIDTDDALPATSLKGVMRATAKHVLGEEADLVGAVFGDAKQPCPWHWGDAVPTGGLWGRPQVTARVRIDAASHTATRDMLALTEETTAARAEFVLTRMAPVTDIELHAAVLAMVARATRSLGAARRRGLGWVSITCPDVTLDRAAVEKVLAWRSV